MQTHAVLIRFCKKVRSLQKSHLPHGRASAGSRARISLYTSRARVSASSASARMGSSAPPG